MTSDLFIFLAYFHGNPWREASHASGPYAETISSICMTGMIVV